MARLLRSTTRSFLRPPILETPLPPARAVLVKHAAVKPRADYTQRHFGKSELRTPTVVDAAFTAPPVVLTLVASPNQARAAHPNLSPPTALAASIVFRGVIVKHAAVKPRADYTQRHFARWRLQPPTTLLSFVASPILRLLAPSPRQARGAHGVLRPPTVVAASIVFRPIKRVLAWTFPRPAAAAHSELRPPTSLVTAILAPIKLTLVAVAAARRPKYRSRLNAPTVVGASIVFAPIRRYLAWQFPRPAAGAHSDLRPPTVTGAVVAVVLIPLRLTLVAVRTGLELIRHRPKSKLKPPTAVDPSIVFPPVDARLAPSGRQARATHSSLKGPTAISGARIFAPIRSKLALQIPRQGRQTHSKLRLPVFKAPDLIAGAVAIVDSVLALVGLSDSSSADVSATDATGAHVQVVDTTASASVTVDDTGDDVTIVEPPR